MRTDHFLKLAKLREKGVQTHRRMVTLNLHFTFQDKVYTVEYVTEIPSKRNKSIAT